MTSTECQYCQGPVTWAPKTEQGLAGFVHTATGLSTCPTPDEPGDLASQVAAEVRKFSAFRLARLADSADPDSQESAGAEFLFHVAADVSEAIEWETSQENRTLAEALDYISEERRHEMADGAVPVYTQKKWETFTDLAAWNEDPTELGCDGSDMDQCANACLYNLADRLAFALIDEARDIAAEITEDEDR